MTRNNLRWQSKLVLLLTLPAAAAASVLLVRVWAENWAPAALWAVGLSVLLGLAAWKARAATPGGAFAGALVTCCLMLETADVNRPPWATALTPVLAVLLLTGLATRLGRAKKLRLGLAESAHGRNAAQVAANIGMATWMAQPVVQIGLIDAGHFAPIALAPLPIFAPMLAALAEAAADTVSSEIGQAVGGVPRMITTLRRVEAGTDGAMSLVGTLAGIAAAGAVAGAGALALGGGWQLCWVSWAGGVFGLFFDSLLGATLERRGWLNNDLVNFLSTASAAAAALGVLALLPHPGAG